VQRAVKVSTGLDDRVANMFAFADAALELLATAVAAAPPSGPT